MLRDLKTFFLAHFASSRLFQYLGNLQVLLNFDSSLRLDSITDSLLFKQGKRRGDPGTDPSTVEAVSKLRSRLFSFWDDLFSPSSSLSTATSSSGVGEPVQILYVSHGAAIREFIQALILERPTDYELKDLPEGEESMLRRGEKRIGNCARTVIEMVPTRINGQSHLSLSRMILSVSILSDN